MTGNGTERAIGQLQSSVDTLTKQVAHQDAKVDILIGHMERQKGGWKVLAGSATVAGVVGGFLSKYIPYT